MGANSAIEWTDATWNPIRARNLKTGKVGWHYEHATTGCEFCYAEGFNKRLGTGLEFKPGHRKDIEIFLDEEMLTLPLRWEKSRMIFPNSMTDLFADFVPDEWIDKIWAVMALTPHHTYQPLTKRAARMRECLSATDFDTRVWNAAVEIDCKFHLPDQHPGYRIMLDPKQMIFPLPNVWLGVSAERQQEWDERKEYLRATPAAIHFASFEPLLGDIVEPRPMSDFIRWAIVGGESGPRARPMHPDWARDLQRQCENAGVRYFFKQWGRWSPSHPDFPKVVPHAVANDGTVYFAPDIAYPDGQRYGEALRAGHDKAHLTSMYPIGKAKAGRLLDGCEYNGFPELVRA